MDFKFGSLIGCSRSGYDHVGMYIGCGSVAHNHKFRGEEIVPLSVFSGGERVFVKKSGVSNPQAVLARLNQFMVNRKSYNWRTRNCEHSANWLRTGKAYSPQLRMFTGCAVALSGLIALSLRSS